MKKVYAIMLTAVMMLSVCNISMFCQAASDGEPINILFIGSSLFYHYNDTIPNMWKKAFPQVCKAGSKNVSVTGACATGATMFEFDPYYDKMLSGNLADHRYTDKLTDAEFTETSTKHYDYVVLNVSRRCSPLNKDDKYTAFEMNATENLIKLAKEKGAKVILAAEFGWNKDYITKYTLVENGVVDGVTTYKEATTKNQPCTRKEQVQYNKEFCNAIANGDEDVSVVNIGDAFELAIDEFDMDLYDPDPEDNDTHQNEKGSYLEAYCIYDFIFRSSCLGVMPDTTYIPDADTAEKIQKVADACILGKKQSIEEMDIKIDIRFEVDYGQIKEPTVTLEELDKGKDFDVSYVNDKNAGTAFINIFGKGVYKGVVIVQFNSNKADISEKSINNLKSQYSVKVYGRKIGQDFNVLYRNDGTATVKIIGKNNWKNKVKTIFNMDFSNIALKALLA